MTKKKLLPFDLSKIQVCPSCGKVDAYEGDKHDCTVQAQRQLNDEYYD